jgi:hypothetical protein
MQAMTPGNPSDSFEQREKNSRKKSRIRVAAWILRNRLIESLAEQGDRFLYKPHVRWHADRSWVAEFDDILERDRRAGASKFRILDRRFTLAQFARSVHSLGGCTAECGVLHGVGSALICRALAGSYKNGERHFAFDSFEGLPEPSEEDRMQSGRHWWNKGSLHAQEAGVLQFLKQFPGCEVVKGWIPDSLSVISDSQFRFVHIDLDLYQSVKDSLAFFYPRTVNRGCLFFDDYGLTSCPGARMAVDEFFSDKQEPVIELATGQAFVIRQI